MPDLLCVSGIALVASGLWMERPSLALMFCGVMALVFGIALIRKRGRA